MMCARFISLKIRSNGGLCVYENEHLTFRKRWKIFCWNSAKVSVLTTPFVESVG